MTSGLEALPELYADMTAVTRQMSTDELLALCDRVDIPATRIYAVDELPAHPHLKAVGLFQPLDHPTEGATVTIRPPTLFARTPASVRLAAPQLGQHTCEVLGAAGIDRATLERLLADGVILQSAPAG